MYVVGYGAAQRLKRNYFFFFFLPLFFPFPFFLSLFEPSLFRTMMPRHHACILMAAASSRTDLGFAIQAKIETEKKKKGEKPTKKQKEQGKEKRNKGKQQKKEVLPFFSHTNTHSPSHTHTHTQSLFCTHALSFFFFDVAN